MLDFFRNRPAPMANPRTPTGFEHTLLLGWDFSRGNAEPVTYDGDAPLLTCASTGSGKGRGVLIPNLLCNSGSVIVIDIKGELFQVTGRARREMGHRVVVLDPFHLVTSRSDSLNPFDLFDLPGSDMDSDAEMLASLLATGHGFSDDPYWETSATSLVAAFISVIAGFDCNQSMLSNRHLGFLRQSLFLDDMDARIGNLVKDNGVWRRLAREQFIAYLAAPAEKTRPCIRTMACSYMNALGSERVLATLQSSSFSLQDVHDGKPLTIYLVIPPDKLHSHATLLRLWIGTLLTAVMRRKVMPRQRTLFLLDECAQLGALPMLRTAITLLRGSGLITHTYWQDLSQLRQVYPKDWQSILNNSGMLQAFGFTNHQMAAEWSELTGQPVGDLDRMPRCDALVLRQGQGSLICQRPDYLKDPLFAGRFDANPRFSLQARA
ncbi:MAG TPA: type IV secretory system conjugative DNA transfer family protein [Gemmataceae bacterium]|nr:type IV secretory system conjugative DNA transfer family protein [Gemmataceae bacterium]